MADDVKCENMTCIYEDEFAVKKEAGVTDDVISTDDALVQIDHEMRSPGTDDTRSKTTSSNSSNADTAAGCDAKLDKKKLLAVLQFLKKNNLKEAEFVLKKEAGVTDDDISTDEALAELEHEMPSLGTCFKCDESPQFYAEQYSTFRHFVETSLDIYRFELSRVLYPLFVHVYMRLIFNNCEDQALTFLAQHSCDHDGCYDDELRQLSIVTKPEHAQGNQLFDSLCNNKFIIRMSRGTYLQMKRFLTEKKMTSLLSVIQRHITLDVVDGAPRTNMAAGGMLGDTSIEANKSDILYGLLPEPAINIPLDDDLDDEDVTPGEDGRPAKKRKSKKDSQKQLKKSKEDPNAPAVNRIPLPELRDCDKLERARAARELSKKVNIGPDVHPSVLFYTFVNASNSLTSVDISEDATLMSAGFSNSIIRVWPLASNKLYRMKSADELGDVEVDCDDVMQRMMDAESAEETRTLFGHSGPVYATSFSPDKSHMVSSSEDGTVRLWNLYTWTNLVSYKGHRYPVWAVKYGPHGHYFASAGLDRTARLWSMEHYQPLRVFAGHLADVECVDFHPNSNYVVTGSTDRTVRLWDVLSGSCVYVMTGHQAPVSTTSFSPDGRYLASAGHDSQILLWDMATGEVVSQLHGHSDVVYSLSFSREGSVLASGSKDNTVRIWDVNKAIMNDDFAGGISSDTSKDGSNLHIASYSTKDTAVQCVHFTRRNVLLAAGPFAHD